MDSPLVPPADSRPMAVELLRSRCRQERRRIIGLRVLSGLTLGGAVFLLVFLIGTVSTHIWPSLAKSGLFYLFLAGCGGSIWSLLLPVWFRLSGMTQPDCRIILAKLVQEGAAASDGKYLAAAMDFASFSTEKSTTADTELRQLVENRAAKTEFERPFTTPSMYHSPSLWYRLLAIEVFLIGTACVLLGGWNDGPVDRVNTILQMTEISEMSENSLLLPSKCEGDYPEIPEEPRFSVNSVPQGETNFSHGDTKNTEETTLVNNHPLGERTILKMVSSESMWHEPILSLLRDQYRLFQDCEEVLPSVIGKPMTDLTTAQQTELQQRTERQNAILRQLLSLVSLITAVEYDNHTENMAETNTETASIVRRLEQAGRFMETAGEWLQYNHIGGTVASQQTVLDILGSLVIPPSDVAKMLENFSSSSSSSSPSGVGSGTATSGTGAVAAVHSSQPMENMAVSLPNSAKEMTDNPTWGRSLPRTGTVWHRSQSGISSRIPMYGFDKGDGIFDGSLR